MEGTGAEEDRERKSGEIPGQLSQALRSLCPHQRSWVYGSWAEQPLKGLRVSEQLPVLVIFHLCPAWLSYHTFLLYSFYRKGNSYKKMNSPVSPRS